jgi:hypothetical protein
VNGTVRAIPWRFASAGDLLQYDWAHTGTSPNATFAAQILRRDEQWTWSLQTGPADNPMWRIGGAAYDFDSAEEMVREAVAKSVKATGSFRDLVDDAGHRYTLGTGVRRDLSALNGRVVRVRFVSSGQEVTGRLTTGEWALLVEHEGVTYEVNPAAVAAVQAA